MSPARAEITVRGLHAGYPGRPVLQDVSFRIDDPAVYVVLGPNGAGKTTLFRALAGILRPTQGEVLIDGRPHDAPDGGGRLHYLSHLDGLPDGLTVREALAFYARVQGAGLDDVDRVLTRLELTDLADRYASQLSAGQKRRAAIARIFLQERPVYLLDEPTANLDPRLAREIRELLLELARDRIVLYSSHNLYEAREIARYVLAIRDGRLAVFDRIENLRGATLAIGVRLLDPPTALAGFRRQGEYFVRDVPGPDAVPGVIRDLVAQGLRIREVREMENPLETLFT